MDAEAKKILADIADQMKKLNETVEGNRDDNRAAIEETKSGLGASNTYQLANKFTSFAAGGVNALKSGDVRNIAEFGATAAGTGLGALTGGLAGAQAGGAFGAAASQGISAVAGLFAPRGFDQFNIFEKLDSTVTEPYKRVENLAAQFARYGVKIPKEELDRWYQKDKEASEREFSTREKIRGWYGSETAPTDTIMGQASDMMTGLKFWVGQQFREPANAQNGGQIEGLDKVFELSRKQRNRNKAITRMDKFDDE